LFLDSHAAGTAPIDWHDLFNRIPDESVILQFAASYRDNALPLFARLEQSIAQQDAKLIESNAHALKGSAANLGAILLAKAAWKLENAARMQQPDLGCLLENVRHEFRRLMDLLARPNWLEELKNSQSTH
jgi:HPt (histidine-containing phosphotransfer) domain-containing protein